MFRKARPLDELIRDPHFPYQVGRLVGAAEMAAHFMKIQQEEQTKEVGKKLHNVVGWFFEGEVNGIPTELGTNEPTGHKESGQHSDSTGGTGSRTRQPRGKDESTSV